jgi:prepilin-type N-terminal cleavage/methylation domain-containing protein
MIKHMTDQGREQQAQGFTLVELIITITLFATLVPSVVGFLDFLTQLNTTARTTASINAFVENKVETIRSAGYTATPVVSNQSITSELNTAAASIPSPKSAVYTVSQLSPSVKQINISVTYNNKGTAKTVSYTTYLGELGVGQY